VENKSLVGITQKTESAFKHNRGKEKLAAFKTAFKYDLSCVLQQGNATLLQHQKLGCGSFGRNKKTRALSMFQGFKFDQLESFIRVPMGEEFRTQLSSVNRGKGDCGRPKSCSKDAQNKIPLCKNHTTISQRNVSLIYP
jgi:hypothetical protein